MRDSYQQEVPVKKILTTIGIVMVLVFVGIFISKSVINVDASEIVVVQSPISGELDVYSEPGVHPQYWGTETHYKKSVQYWFDGKEGHEQPIAVKFNDGGHATIPGSIRITLPTDKTSMIKLHTLYGSQKAIEEQLVGQILAKSIYMAGPTMTSKEAYAEKKTNLLYYVEDQAKNGIYKTTQRDAEVPDLLTGQKRTVTVVDIVTDSSGQPARVERSLVGELNVGLSNLSFGDFGWDDVVKKQIATQQQATMQVQTAIAKAKEAEQEAITTEQQGKANAAKAKWEQETIKAQAVTEAEQQLAVAKLNAQTEAQNKLAMQLKGEGEAAYKRAVTQANNNLELRLNAAIEINKAYANAMASSNWVPTYIGGAGAGGAANGGGALDLIHLMTANAAREAGLVPQGQGRDK